MEVLMENLYIINREQWDMCRNLAYFIVQPQTKKKINPKKLMAFPWDSEEKFIHSDHHGVVSENEKKMMEAEATYLEQTLFSDQNKIENKVQ